MFQDVKTSVKGSLDDSVHAMEADGYRIRFRKKLNTKGVKAIIHHRRTDQGVKTPSSERKFCVVFVLLPLKCFPKNGSSLSFNMT